MASLGLLLSLTPYYILSYGTLLGTEVFQSFIAGVQAYRVLPRPQFSTLQSAIFPIYFSMQTALPILLALTFPGSAHGTQISSTTSTTSWGVSRTVGGLAGVFEPMNRWAVLTPLATIFVTSLVNLVYVGPTTIKVMRDRKHQETRDGKCQILPRKWRIELLAFIYLGNKLIYIDTREYD
jgi:Domain of unknown function (DUF4149)